MKALVGSFNQERALVGAFSVIVQPVVEPMDGFAALVLTHLAKQSACAMTANNTSLASFLLSWPVPTTRSVMVS